MTRSTKTEAPVEATPSAPSHPDIQGITEANYTLFQAVNAAVAEGLTKSAAFAAVAEVIGSKPQNVQTTFYRVVGLLDKAGIKTGVSFRPRHGVKVVADPKPRSKTKATAPAAAPKAKRAKSTASTTVLLSAALDAQAKAMGSTVLADLADQARALEARASIGDQVAALVG